MRVFIVSMIVLILAGCSLNDTMTKTMDSLDKMREVADAEYHKALTKIIEKVGGENIRLALELYDDAEAAKYLVDKYEELTGEKFSDRNRDLLEFGVRVVLEKLRLDMKKETDEAKPKTNV